MMRNIKKEAAHAAFFTVFELHVSWFTEIKKLLAYLRII